MQAERFALQGLEFLNCYGKLSALAYQRKMRRYALIPKLHYFHHLMIDLLESSRSNTWTLSPMVYSVQLQEDYIGRPSRISRRVSPKCHSLRTIQRVLLAMFAEFKKVEEKQ